MKVYFVGAGPGAADLITIRGSRLLGAVKYVLYAGSLVPESMLEHCRRDAVLVNTAGLNLDEQVAFFKKAYEEGEDLVRLHSGDPAIYGATSEQMRRLEMLGIEYEIVPGVSSFSAAAAAFRAELTKPQISQTIILTRVSGRASAVPAVESLSELARHGATLCIFLSGPHLKQIVDELKPFYPEDTPVALVNRVSWADERRHESTLGRIAEELNPSEWALTTMMLVGKVLSKEAAMESRLYSSDYSHKFRRAVDVR